MAASKAFMKDALILFAITLVSGICLGFVYDITKGPIEQATMEANNKTYQQVLSSASAFADMEGSGTAIADLAASGALVVALFVVIVSIIVRRLMKNRRAKAIVRNSKKVVVKKEQVEKPAKVEKPKKAKDENDPYNE